MGRECVAKMCAGRVVVVSFSALGIRGLVGGGLCSCFTRPVCVYAFGACLGRDDGGCCVSVPDLCVCLFLARVEGGTMAGNDLSGRRRTASSVYVLLGAGVGRSNWAMDRVVLWKPVQGLCLSCVPAHRGSEGTAAYTFKPLLGSHCVQHAIEL